MNYQLVGHDRNNAVQDLLICLLPQEEHLRAADAPGADLCRSTLDIDPDGALTARAFVRRGGVTHTGQHREPPPPPGAVAFNRAAGYAVKTALYHALIPCLEAPPVWGTLTGVKPGKAVRAFMERGLDDAQAQAMLEARYFVEPIRAKLCVDTARAAMDAQAQLAPKEVQLYAGIPFCPAKCSYCSFVSNGTKTHGHLIGPYLDALCQEIDSAGQMVARRQLTIGSLYLGGGTPTILDAGQLDRLLAALHSAFDLSHCREISVEGGRPETIDRDKLEVMARHGVTRVSINPQTMNDAVLAGVGRHHTGDDIVGAYELTRSVNNFAVNMDLIAGLPGDSDDSLLDSVQRLIALGPENITVHCLARKKGAPLRYGEQGRLPAHTLDACYALLGQAGYAPYYLYRQKYIAGGLENTGWAKPGTHSFYNICMMEELGDTLALGSGGVTKLCAEGGQRIRRITNPKYPHEYIAGIDQIMAQKQGL